MNSTIKALLLASAIGALSSLQATTGSKTIPGDFPGNPKDPLVLCALRLKQLQAEQIEAANRSYQLCQYMKIFKQTIVKNQQQQSFIKELATHEQSGQRQEALSFLGRYIDQEITHNQQQIQVCERDKATCEQKLGALDESVCDLREREQLALIARGLPLPSFEYDNQDDAAAPAPAPALPPRPVTVRQRTISAEEPGQTPERPARRQRVV